MIEINLTKDEMDKLKEFLAKELDRGGTEYTNVLLKLDNAIR